VAATRRTEPDRRDRLIDVALDVVAEVGVAGASHRKIAARADVPLGSMTYHFDGMDELLHEAFSRFAETIIVRFEARLGGATSRDEAKEAVVALVHDDLTGPAAVREITREWMRRSRVELERHFDPDTARQVDALIEGLSIHRALDPSPPSRALTREAVERITRVA
jgi:DNA-binding transcriptional regulator YbjK